MKKTKGFTLIELLVVVLIIGILAAVAVPQYQKAVEKSKAMEALTTLKSIYQSAQMYYLTNGNFPQSFGQLDISIPWKGKDTVADIALLSDFISNRDWSLMIEHDSCIGMGIERLSGPYTGSGFWIWKSYASPNLQLNKIYCFERHNGKKIFKQEQGSFCSKLFKGTKGYKGGYIQYYQIP